MTQLMAQTFFIGRFEQAGTKDAVHLNRRANDLPGQRIFFHHVLTTGALIR
jgi:hypothetical protein